MDLIYLRHGLTDWNVEHRLQGRTDVPLNQTGIDGAIRAGRILKHYKIDAVYCSPLLRARQTLAHALPDACPVHDDRLMEWNFGPLEGQCLSPDFFKGRWALGAAPIAGVEQMEDVLARVSAFYREIRERHKEETVLVVSHGGISGALHGAIYGVAEGENLNRYCLPNSTPVLFREGQRPIVLEVKSHD